MVLASNYMLDQGDVRYFPKGTGEVLEQRMSNVEDTLQDTSGKIDRISEQQVQMMIMLGRLEEKIDGLRTKK